MGSPFPGVLEDGSMKGIGLALLAGVLLVTAASSPAVAQAQTASQFYLSYRAAFDKAKKVEDILPYMAKKNVDQVNQTPAAERAKMFEMMKMMGTITNVKIVKETKSATGATLDVEALDPDKKKTTGSIEVVKEAGAWKLGSETWK
jgi:uncharacterized protein DUF4878